MIGGEVYMIIGGIQKLSLIDYPDEPAIVLFTSGCNFDCFYCHNPELKKPELSLDMNYVLDFLKTRFKYLNHVVICGGEPTVHPDLFDFIKLIKSLGTDIKVKLDTNGSIYLTDELLNLIDFIAMDIKAPLDKYKSIVKADVDLNILLSNVARIKSNCKNFIFRTTKVPGINNSDIDKIKREFELYDILDKYIIQEYKKPGGK